MTKGHTKNGHTAVETIRIGKCTAYQYEAHTSHEKTPLKPGSGCFNTPM